MRKRLILLLLAAAFFTLILSALTAHAMPDSALKIGSKGPDVKELQQKLAENGVLEERYGLLRTRDRGSGIFIPGEKQYKADRRCG